MTTATASLHHVDANGVRFGYLAQGTGPLVLLLHGFPDNAHTYARQLEFFSDAGFHAVAPFLRGYAPTEVPTDGKFDPAVLAEDLQGLVAALSDTGSACVLGMDWGGTAIQAALSRSPSNIAAAVIMNTAHPATFPHSVRDPEFLYRIFHLWYFQLEIAARTVAIEGLPFVDYLWRYWSPALHNETHIRSVKKTLSEPGTLPAALAYYPALVNSFFANTFPVGPIATPTLSIFGENDPTAKHSRHEEPVFCGPYRRMVLPDVGHFPHREREAEVNALALDWFTQHARR